MIQHLAESLKIRFLGRLKSRCRSYVVSIDRCVNLRELSNIMRSFAMRA